MMIIFSKFPPFACRAVGAFCDNGDPPVFVRSVNPISTKEGADCADHVTNCPHGFSNLPLAMTHDTLEARP